MSLERQAFERRAQLERQRRRRQGEGHRPRTFLSACQSYRPVPLALFSCELEVLKRQGAGTPVFGVHDLHVNTDNVGVRRVITPTGYRNGSLANEALGVGGYMNVPGVQSPPPDPRQEFSSYRLDTKKLLSSGSGNLPMCSSSKWGEWLAAPSDGAKLKERLRPGGGDLGNRRTRDGYKGYMPQLKQLACMTEPGVYGECGLGTSHKLV